MWRPSGISLGFPSFVVINDGEELGRLVNKNRKTKDEIAGFFATSRRVGDCYVYTIISKHLSRN